MRKYNFQNFYFYDASKHVKYYLTIKVPRSHRVIFRKFNYNTRHTYRIFTAIISFAFFFPAI